MSDALNKEKANKVYRISPQVVVENFDEGALVLCLKDRHILELNPIARDVLAYTNVIQTTGKVAYKMAAFYQIPRKEAMRDVIDLYEQLAAQGVVEAVEDKKTLKESKIMSQNSISNIQYLRNPDVVLHKEDPDGALLFNPDTNQTLVLNATGFFVWKHCDGSRTLTTILSAIKETFKDVPETEVIAEVKDLITQLQAKGFIGVSDYKK